MPEGGKIVSWDDTESASSGQFMDIEHGHNQARILSQNPYEVWVHWHKNPEGKTIRFLCPGSGCPLCSSNESPSRRFAVVVLNRKTRKVEILEQGPMVFGQIKNKKKITGYEDPRRYDIVITKSGKGTMHDTDYDVTPTPPSPLTPEEIDFIKQNYIKIETAYKLPSLDEVKQLIGLAPTVPVAPISKPVVSVGTTPTSSPDSADLDKFFSELGG